MHIQRAEPHITQICLVAPLTHCFSIAIASIIRVFLIRLCPYGCLKIYYGFLILSEVEIHYASVEQEIFSPKNVFLVIAERLYKLCLLQKLLISCICDLEGVLGFLGAFHSGCAIGVILQSLATESSHLF
jgi:hypothetical protein